MMVDALHRAASAFAREVIKYKALKSFEEGEMARYFKLVSLGDPDWILGEFREGRARFGWSPPGTDLRHIRDLTWKQCSEEQLVAWSYMQSLLKRVVGDRVVIQYEKPINNIIVGEVIAPGYDFTSETLPDFNHILHVRPLTTEPVPVNSKAVSGALKHDLSKRGHYYEIYPQTSIEELDSLVEAAQASTLELGIRSDEDTRDKTVEAIKKAIVKEISRQWPAKDFERFCESLCNTLEYVEVKERKDSGKGWDLLVRLMNPLTNTVLMDDIPVQCKNYTGEIVTTQPIEDLARCVENSKTCLAMLFIVGDLTHEFRNLVQLRQEELTTRLGRTITFEIIDQERIAELYARLLSTSIQAA